MSEVACVCPRCGVPFTLIVVKSAGKQAQKPPQSEGNSAPQREVRPAVAPTASAKPSQSAASPPRREMQNPPLNPSIKPHYPPPINPSIHYQKPSNRGCLRSCLIVFLLMFFAVVLVVRNYIEDHSYTQDILRQESVLKAHEQDGDEQRRTAKSNREQPPSWLKGSWRAETQEGVVVITIYGNWIVELFDGEEHRGTFIYKRGKLYCDFGDGEPIIRKINLKKRYILYGDQPMEKQ